LNRDSSKIGKASKISFEILLFYIIDFSSNKLNFEVAGFIFSGGPCKREFQLFTL